MTDNMVEITVEVLDILAIATKELRQGRESELIPHLTILEADLMGLETFLKRVIGQASLEDGLMKLDKLTNVGARMASIEVLRHIIDKKVIDISDYSRVVDEKVLSVEDKVQLLRDSTINAIDDKVEIIVPGTQVCLESHQLLH